MKLDRMKVFAKVSLFVSFSIVLFICTAAILAGCKKKEKAAPPPPEVEVVSVSQKDVPIYSEYVGTADGLYVDSTTTPAIPFLYGFIC